MDQQLPFKKKLIDLSSFGMKWGEPPPHVVPDLSMTDKLRVLIQFPGEWSMVSWGMKQSTAKTMATSLRNMTHQSIRFLSPFPVGVFDAVHGLENTEEETVDGFAVWARYLHQSGDERIKTFLEEKVEEQRRRILEIEEATS